MTSGEAFVFADHWGGASLSPNSSTLQPNLLHAAAAAPFHATHIPPAANLQDWSGASVNQPAGFYRQPLYHRAPRVETLPSQHTPFYMPGLSDFCAFPTNTYTNTTTAEQAALSDNYFAFLNDNYEDHPTDTSNSDSPTSIPPERSSASNTPSSKSDDLSSRHSSIDKSCTNSFKMDPIGTKAKHFPAEENVSVSDRNLLKHVIENETMFAYMCEHYATDLFHNLSLDTSLVKHMVTDNYVFHTLAYKHPQTLYAILHNQ